MSCEFGSRVRVTLFGQSHGEAVGAVLDGLPAGEEIDLSQAQAFLRRRAPGQNAWSTPRRTPPRGWKAISRMCSAA